MIIDTKELEIEYSPEDDGRLIFKPNAMIKVYLICEDIDPQHGAYCVKGSYVDKHLAESKLKEYLGAWVTRRFINCEIPEELLTEDGLINAYSWHYHFIEEEEGEE